MCELCDRCAGGSPYHPNVNHNTHQGHSICSLLWFCKHRRVGLPAQPGRVLVAEQCLQPNKTPGRVWLSVGCMLAHSNATTGGRLLQPSMNVFLLNKCLYHVVVSLVLCICHVATNVANCVQSRVSAELSCQLVVVRHVKTSNMVIWVSPGELADGAQQLPYPDLCVM